MKRAESSLVDENGERVPVYKIDGKGRDCRITHRNGGFIEFKKVYYSHPSAGTWGLPKRRMVYKGLIFSETENEILYSPMKGRMVKIGQEV